jgi:pimeloyl-ACP methyl ester carboxylesterase
MREPGVEALDFGNHKTPPVRPVRRARLRPLGLDRGRLLGRRLVRDLETVVDALGLDRFALLGIPQGGAVAAAYAARHPERVSHLILYGAYAR